MGYSVLAVDDARISVLVRPMMLWDEHAGLDGRLGRDSGSAFGACYCRHTPPITNDSP